MFFFLWNFMQMMMSEMHVHCKYRLQVIIMFTNTGYDGKVLSNGAANDYSLHFSVRFSFTSDCNLMAM